MLEAHGESGEQENKIDNDSSNSMSDAMSAHDGTRRNNKKPSVIVS